MFKPEMVPRENLLEVFADKEVSIFGVTGTFKDLAGMCPVDLSDPRITIEAKNEFVVKAVNEAGLEVDAKYESIFSQITEQHGLERKFTVAPSEAPPAANKKADINYLEEDIKDKTPDKFKVMAPEAKLSDKTAERPDLTQPTGASTERIRDYERLTGMLVLNDLAQLPKLNASENRKNDMARKIDPLSPVPIQKLVAKRNTRPIQAPVIFKANKKKEVQTSSIVREKAEQHRYGISSVSNEQQLLEVVTSVDVFDNPVAGSEIPPMIKAAQYDETYRKPWENEEFELPNELAVNNLLEETSDTSLIEEEVVKGISEDLTGDTAPPIVENLSLASSTEQEDLILAWEAEIAKEPLKIYDDFTEGLSAFLLNIEETPEVHEEFFPTEANSVKEDSQPETCPPIVASVFESLKEVGENEKEELAIILKDIVGAIHGLTVMEANDADAEVKERVEEQLLVLCEVLLNRLGIEYDEAALCQLIEVLQKPVFSSVFLIDKTEIEQDLENTGTREVKHLRILVSNSLSKVHWHLILALGTFALA